MQTHLNTICVFTSMPPLVLTHKTQNNMGQCHYLSFSFCSFSFLSFSALASSASCFLMSSSTSFSFSTLMQVLPFSRVSVAISTETMITDRHKEPAAGRQHSMNKLFHFYIHLHLCIMFILVRRSVTGFEIMWDQQSCCVVITWCFVFRSSLKKETWDGLTIWHSFAVNTSAVFIYFCFCLPKEIQVHCVRLWLLYLY